MAEHKTTTSGSFPDLRLSPETTPNRSPLTQAEANVIERCGKKDMEYYDKLITLMIEISGNENIQNLPTNEYKQISEQAKTTPAVLKKRGEVDKFELLKGGLIVRADLRHEFEKLVQRQAKSEIEEKREQSPMAEQQIKDHERRLFEDTRKLFREIEELEIVPAEKPQFDELQSELKCQLEVGEDSNLICTQKIGEVQKLKRAFDAVFRKPLSEGQNDKIRVSGYRLTGIDELGKHYTAIGRKIEEGIGETNRELKNPFSSHPARRAVLTHRLDQITSEIKSIEAEYRAKNTVNGVLLLEEVGHGAIASIRRARVRGGIAGLRGEITDGDEVEIAIKIPLPAKDDTFAEQNYARQVIEATKDEARQLDRFRQGQSELFPKSPPHFIDSELIEIRKLPALAMEFIPQGYNIASSERLSPNQLFDAMVQHYEVLAIIHSLGFTVIDRKGGDLYYFPKTGRYVILDWNSIKVKNISNLIAELKLGIDLFYEIATGKSRYSASPIRDFEEGRSIFTPQVIERIKSLQKHLQDHGLETTAMDAIRILKGIS